MAMESIIVRYLRPDGVPFGLYHKCIIYTDKNGIQYYARGGNVGSGSTGLGAFGTVVTISGIYAPGTPDWPRADDIIYDSLPIIEGEDISTLWNKI